ncbi:MAG: T9SS type A sorting domain-containing protein [Calditrichaeota bacterium]|nr:T9SS type A sorting domain-containing protein [Calditrichota bacterium]
MKTEKLAMVSLLLIGITLIVTNSARAQIEEIWSAEEGVAQFLGVANMDDDAQVELVYRNNNLQQIDRIIIIDSESGRIDWEGDRRWSAICTNGSSLFVDLGNGRKGITFAAKGQGEWDPFIVYLIGQRGEDRIGANPEDGFPQTIELNQNYPNPFNPSTTINYSISKIGLVSIIIYNELGQVVRELVNEEQTAGNYSIVWDGRNNSGNTIASGIYFYQMQLGSKLSAKKMLLLK